MNERPESFISMGPNYQEARSRKPRAAFLFKFALLFPIDPLWW